MTFDAGSVSARLELDRSAFTAGLDQAKADADKFTSKPITAKITADGADAKRTLDDLTARADALSKKAAAIKVTADATQANTELDKTSAKADALGRKAASVKVQADATQADAALDKTSAKADALGAKTPTIKVGADTTGADADLDKTSAKADLIGRKTETIKVKTDTDTSGIDNLSKKISDLTSGPFSLLKTAIVGLGPAAVPVLGAVTAAVLPLTAAIGSAATGLGAFGLVADKVLTQAGTAYTAVSKAQTTYTAAIAGGTKQSTAYAAEQKAIAVAYAGMSTQQITLSKQVGDLSTAYKGMLTSVTPLVSSALVPWMKDVQQLLQYIKPLITPIAALFKTWGDELNRALTGNQANITRFVEAFAGRSVTNIRLFGDALLQFAKGAGALIHDIAPNLSGAAGGIVKLATSFDGWAKSQKTADAIKGFFAWAKAEAPAVKKFLEELATSVGHLIKAMAFAGGGDLKVLTAGLSAIAALPSAAIVALADGYVAISLGLRAATIAMGAWNIVSTVAKGIQAALNTEIKVTGAELVIQRIATLALAAADVVMDAAETVYIALMLVADAVSLPLIAVIGGIVVAVAALAVGIYELVTHWNTVWHAITSGAADIRGAFDSIRHAAAGLWDGITKPAIQAFDAVKTFVTGSFDAWWKSHGQEIKAVWGAIWTAVKDVFVPIWNAIVAAAKIGWAVITGVFRVEAALVTAVFKTAWDVMAAVVKVAWAAIQAVTQTAWAVITGIFRVEAAVITVVFKNGWDVITTIVKVAWAAIQAVIKIAWDLIVGIISVGLDLITGHWKQAWTDVTNTATQVWNALKQFFGATLTAISALFTQALNNIKSFLSTTWNAISSTAQSAWNAIKAFFVSWWSAVSGLFTQVTNTIKSTLSTAWNAIESTAKTVFGGILTYFGGFWSALRAGFAASVTAIGQAWTGIENVVKTPVQWVIQHVYDDLIVPFWNATGGAVGLPQLKKMAEGGVVPGGYSRDDNQLVWMRSGEGVLQPGAVTALGGPGFIDWANSAYGDVPVGSSGAGHYAAGGTGPSTPGRGGALGATNPSGPALGPLAGVAHDIASVVSDATNGIFDTLASIGTKIVDDAAKLVPGKSGVADAMRAAPPKIWSAFLAWVTAHAPAPSGGGGGGVNDTTGIPWLGTTLPPIATMIKYFGPQGDPSHETMVSFAGHPLQINKVLAGNATALGSAVAGAGLAGGIRDVGGFRTSIGGSGSPIPFSMHQFGAAFDVNEDGGPNGNWQTMTLPAKMVQIAQTYSWFNGQNWGGGSRDGGHFQFTGGGGKAAVGAGSPGKGDLIANASAIGAYLLGHGANKIAAAGIMGNMLQESGGAWNAPGGGLIQIIADGQPSSLAQSLAQTIAYINQNGGMGPINAAQNVAQATEIFMNQYERPAPATENLARRLAGAAAAYAAGYDSGGWLQPGTTLVRNDTGRPEPVLNPDQWENVQAMAGGDIGDKLDRIAGLLMAGPRATASGVSEVLNGTSHTAAFRRRYPRNN